MFFKINYITISITFKTTIQINRFGVSDKLSILSFTLGEIIVHLPSNGGGVSWMLYI